jgi:hypothetical protein
MSSLSNRLHAAKSNSGGKNSTADHVRYTVFGINVGVRGRFVRSVSPYQIGGGLQHGRPVRRIFALSGPFSLIL